MPNAKIIHDLRDSVVRTARQQTITPTRMYTAEVIQSRIGSSTEPPPRPRDGVGAGRRDERDQKRCGGAQHATLAGPQHRSKRQQ